MYNNISVVWGKDGKSLEIGVVPGPMRCQSHEWWFLSSVLHFWAGVFPLSPPLHQSAPAAGDHTDAPPGQSSCKQTKRQTHRNTQLIKGLMSRLTSSFQTYIKRLYQHSNQYNIAYVLLICSLFCWLRLTFFWHRNLIKLHLKASLGPESLKRKRCLLHHL